MSHRSGFVNILGNPNVGKSTIMNALVGEKLSIISPKAQTTRHRIMGIVNGDDFQIVYSDTPGILKPKYKLQETMMNSVNSALTDADMILYITDVTERSADESEYIDRIKSSGIPAIIAINKIDLTNQDELEKIVESWHKAFPLSPVIPISALNSFNLDALLNAVLGRLPEGPPYFPKDQLTDKFEKFFASEIIREKILFHYKRLRRKSVCCVALRNSSLRRTCKYASFLISCAPCLRSFLQTRLMLPLFSTFCEYVKIASEMGSRVYMSFYLFCVK